MPNIVRFVISYDAKLYRSIIFRQFYRNSFVKTLTVIGAFSLIMSALYPLGINPLRFEIFPLFALLYGIITLTLPLLLWWKTGKRFQGNPIFREPMHYEVSEEGLSIRSKSFQKDLKWKDFSHVLFIQSHPVLFTSPAGFFFIPINQLTEEQSHFLNQMILLHVPKKG
jgi:hypothetical protein